MTRSEALTMSIEEVAHALGVSRHLTYDLARQGRIPVLRLGVRRLRVPRVRFEEFMAGGWQPPGGNGRER